MTDETPSSAPIQVIPPDWQEWLAKRADAVATTPEQYDLHLAAVEWSLAEPLAINDRDDFQSLSHIRVEPFDHQVEDAILFFRRLLPRGLIADDVGLGKTITAGLIARELMDRGRVESILVVCPKPLLEQWRDELSSKFGIEAVPACGGEFIRLGQHDCWITTYHTARARIDEITRRGFDLMILDEAHALRNLYGTQKPPKMAVAFQQLMQSDTVSYVIALTATPIQNRLWDIYSQIDILKAPQPNPFGTPTRFAGRFIQDQQTARALRPGTELEFRQLVGETTIRTRRADTKLLFPDREVRNSGLKPKKDEAEFIEKAMPTILKFPTLTQYTYARSLMSSPWALAASFEKKAQELLLPQSFRDELREIASEGRRIRSSAKTDAVLEMVRQSVRDRKAERLLVFTMRIETLNHLFTVLEEAGFGDQVAVMRGGQDFANRQAIDDFMAEPAVRPILLATDTGAVGLNLQAGNIVVNYDLPWNPMLIEQRIGRVQRLGQQAAHVIVYNLFLRDTIEDRVVRRLMEKLNLFNQAIGEMEELLELCDYDDEQDSKRSLDQIIMELIRKAAERKDIERDLAKMEESRRLAEIKMQAMREATDSALASIRPPDLGIRLEGLERVVPRVPLRDLLVACIEHRGDEAIHEPDGRLLMRRGNTTIELALDPADREPRVEGARAPVLVSPGSRGFERLVEPLRDQIAHRVLDAQGCSLDEVEARLRDRLETLDVVLDGLQEIRRESHSAVGSTCRVRAIVATDSYETLVHTDVPDSGDGVGEFASGARRLDPRGYPLEPMRGRDAQRLQSELRQLEGELAETVRTDPSIRKFAEFYRARYDEDVLRLARHINGGQDLDSDDDAEEIVVQEAQRTRAIRTAYESIQNRFSTRVRIEPAGARGVLYERAAVAARVRNRSQGKAHPIELEVVPLTGATRSELPLTERALRDGDAWACPGGHLCHSSEFQECAAGGCGDGLCDDCRSVPAQRDRLTTCSECERPFCVEHRVACTDCGKILCREHAIPLTTRGGFVCAACCEVLDDGQRAPASEVARSAVSGRRGLRKAMLQSPVSGDYFFPDEGEVCEATNERLPAADLEVCALTHRRVRKDLLESDAATGDLVLREFLVPSVISGRKAVRDRLRPSPRTGRMALPDEYAKCSVCGVAVPADELGTCSETGLRLCPDHMMLCEESAERVAPTAVDMCSVTGKQVRRSLLGSEEVDGATVLRRLLMACEHTGNLVLAEHLDVSSVSGKRVLKSLLERCEESGRLALPEELKTCEVSGRHVHPDLVIECPETNLHLSRTAAVHCEATGFMMAPSGLETCEATGKRVRRSLLGIDDVTGSRVQLALLRECEVSGTKTRAENLDVSSVSGKRVLKSLLERCEESGRLALPEELKICEVSGRHVHPDFVIECPETNLLLSRSAAVHCDATGVETAPSGLETCEATGKRVRRSLLGIDDVTGSRVQLALLRECEVSGTKTRAENLDVSSVSGKRVLKSLLERCEESGRLALPEELKICEVSGRHVHPDFVIECPETNLLLSRGAAVRCEATGVETAPSGLETCEATGRRVRRSLLDVDEFTLSRVQRDLLRKCEVSGTKTRAANLDRCVVTGRRVLRDRLVPCEVSGELALPQALERCRATGKLVLPRLLESCSVSRARVLRDLLQKCEATGKLALSEHLDECSETHRRVLRSQLTTSELTGRKGLRNVAALCEFTNRKGFRSELVTSEFSAKQLSRDRMRRCTTCESAGDLSEMQRCSICQLDVCAQDAANGVCRSCAELLTGTTTHRVGADEIKTLRHYRDWARRAESLDRGTWQRVLVRPSALAVWKQAELLVMQASGGGESAHRVERAAALVTSEVRRHAKRALAKFAERQFK